MKELLHQFPNMRLCLLSAISHAKVNGTFRVAEGGGKYAKTKEKVGVKAGAAITADPVLSKAIHGLTSLRAANLGPLTKLVRKWQLEDDKEASAKRQKHSENKTKEQIRLASDRADRANTAHEVKLLVTKDSLRGELLACEGIKKQCLIILKQQFDGRVCGRGFLYPETAIDMDFRSDHTRKLKKGPPAGREEVAYMQELIEKMIEYDLAVGQVEARPVVKLARILHSISVPHTMARSIDLKKELLDKLSEAAAPIDDELLLQLIASYKGRLLYDYERDKKTYRIDDIMYVANKNNLNWPCWEATCIPVELSPDNVWSVPSVHLVKGSSGAAVIKKKAFVGFGLVELIGEAEIPTPMPWVDLYIARHEDLQASGKYRTQKNA